MPNYIYNPKTKEFLKRDDTEVPWGFRSATQEDKDNYNKQVDYEAKPLVGSITSDPADVDAMGNPISATINTGSKLEEIGKTVNKEAGRAVLGTLETIDKYVPDPSAVFDSQPDPEAHEFKAREIAPSLYDKQSLEERDRHPVAAGIGQAVVQAPLVAISGGTSLPGQAATFLARNAAFGLATEANESVIAARDFDPEQAAFDGTIGALFDGATSGAARIFHGPAEYFTRATQKALDAGVTDTVRAPASSAAKGEGASIYGKAVDDAHVSAVDAAESKLDETWIAQQKKKFNAKNVKKSVNQGNFEAQRKHALATANEINQAANRLEDQSQGAVLRNYADQLDEIANQAAARPEGPGTRDLELHEDATPMVDQEARKTQKIDEFRRRQAEARGEKPAETPDGPAGDDRVPEDKRLFGVKEKDFNGGEISEFDNILWGNGELPASKYKTPHELNFDENGSPILDEVPQPKGANGPSGQETLSELVPDGPEGSYGTPKQATGANGTAEPPQTGLDALRERVQKRLAGAKGGPEGAVPPNGDFVITSDPTIKGYAKALREIADSDVADKIGAAKNAVPDFAHGSPKSAGDVLSHLGTIERTLGQNVEGNPFSGYAKKLRDVAKKAAEAKDSASAFLALREAEIVANQVAEHPQLSAAMGDGSPIDEIADVLYEKLQDESLWGPKLAKMVKEEDWFHTNFNADNRLLPEISTGDLVEQPEFPKINAAKTPEARGLALQETKARIAMQSKDPKVRAIGFRLQEALDGHAAGKLAQWMPELTNNVRDFMGKNGPIVGNAIKGTVDAIPIIRDLPFKDLSQALEGTGRKLFPGFVPSEEASRVLQGKNPLRSGADPLAEAADVAGMSAYNKAKAGAYLGAGAIGGAVAGPWGAAGGMAAVKLGDRLLSGYEKQVAAGQMIQGITQSTGRRIKSAAMTLTNPAWTRDPLIRAAGISGSNALAAFQGDHGDLHSAYQSRKGQLAKLNQDPMLLVHEMTDAFSDLGDINPQVQMKLVEKTYEALNFVKSKIPATIGTSLVRKDGIPPSYVSMRSFALYYTAATDPSSVVEDLRSGYGTREQIETLKTVYPTIYNDLKTSIFESLGEAQEPPTFAQRARLSTLFDFGGTLDAALSPQLGMRAEQARQAAKAKPGVSPGSSGKSADSKVSRPAQLEQLENSQSVYG